jgi:uncharacterized membrane protein
MNSKNSDVNLWLTTSRLETLVDGIFAIAMTLLVLNLVVPTGLSALSEAAFQAQLTPLIPDLFIYALSFWLLSSFWRMNHQQFYFIERSNPTMVRINMIWLLFVALMPFSTNLMVNYSEFYTSNVIFQLNLFLIGFFYLLNWYYASKNNLVQKGIDEKTLQYFKMANLVMPTLSLMALGLSFFIYGWSSLIYFLIPVLKKILLLKLKY